MVSLNSSRKPSAEILELLWGAVASGLSDGATSQYSVHIFCNNTHSSHLWSPWRALVIKWAGAVPISQIRKLRHMEVNQASFCAWWHLLFHEPLSCFPARPPPPPSPLLPLPRSTYYYYYLCFLTLVRWFCDSLYTVVNIVSISDQSHFHIVGHP